ncbi:hypothetical protein KHM83_19265 [Fusibacter paucivorans]|uniref:Uncharacterized protein n=1 Tax=Fusibacter paucivorans TaxID=76009 RepID=A0ABS5PVQ2_9FIRM|nr:hypothetical protein [Fusibacter paucivorans]MBS7528811.1 hypothetical protein [Fusibacter paucivorans]
MKRIRTTSIIGIISFIIGAILRLSARNLAWPKEYSYGVDRSETAWAIFENGLSDISMMIMLFGVIVCAITVVRYLWTQEKNN